MAPITLPLCIFVISSLLLGCSGPNNNGTQANGGADQTAGAYNRVNLSGKTSKAGDGGALIYQWKPLNTTLPIIAGSLSSAEVSFYIPSSGIPATGADIELTVTDSLGNKSTDQVKILPEPSCAPTQGDLFSNCLINPRTPVVLESSISNSTVNTFTEGFGNNNAFLKWAIIDSQETAHGKIIDLVYGSEADRQAAFKIQNPEGYPQDLTAFSGGAIEFDIRVLDSGTLTPSFSAKIEAISTDPLPEISFELASSPTWQHIKIPLQSFIDKGVNLARVTHMLVINPTLKDQHGVHIHLDNIRWSAPAGAILPKDIALKRSAPMPIGYPALAGTAVPVNFYSKGASFTAVSNGPYSPAQWSVTGNQLNASVRPKSEFSYLNFDMKNIWGDQFKNMINDHALSFTFKGAEQLSAGVYLILQTPEYKTSTSIYPLDKNNTVEIPLTAFDNIGDALLDAINIVFTNDTENLVNITLSSISLKKLPLPTITQSPIVTAFTGRTVKIGGSLCTGPSCHFSWKQLSGPAIDLIGWNAYEGYQIEFIAPKNPTGEPISFSYSVTGPTGTSEQIVTLKLNSCSAPPGVIYENCLADTWSNLGGIISYRYPTEQYDDLNTQEIVSDTTEHDRIIDVSFSKLATNGWFQLTPYEPTDMSIYAGGSVEFDLKVIKYADNNTMLQAKVGCVSPCESHAIVLAEQPLNEWRHISILTDTLINRGLNIQSVDALLKIAPPQGQTAGAHFQLDNIRWVAKQGNPSAADYQQVTSKALTVGSPIKDKTTAKITAYDNLFSSTDIANLPKAKIHWDVLGNQLIASVQADSSTPGLLIDLQSAWGSDLNSYLGEYALSFTIKGLQPILAPYISMIMVHDQGLLPTSSVFIAADGNPAPENAVRVNAQGQVNIPLQTFTSLGSKPFRYLNIGFSNLTPVVADVIISDIKLINISLPVLPEWDFINADAQTTTKIGQEAQPGFAYEWQPLGGTDFLFNPTSAQQEIRFPCGSSNALSYKYRIFNPLGESITQYVVVTPTNISTPQECARKNLKPPIGSWEQRKYIGMDDYTTSSPDQHVQWNILNTNNTQNPIIDVQFSEVFDSLGGLYIRPDQIPADLSAYRGGTLEFDLNVVQYAFLSRDLFVSAESTCCSSAVIYLSEQPLNQWKHVSIPINKLIESRFDLSTVKKIFAISPPYNTQMGAHFQLADVRWVMPPTPGN